MSTRYCGKECGEPNLLSVDCSSGCEFRRQLQSNRWFLCELSIMFDYRGGLKVFSQEVPNLIHSQPKRFFSSSPSAEGFYLLEAIKRSEVVVLKWASDKRRVDLLDTRLFGLPANVWDGRKESWLIVETGRRKSGSSQFSMINWLNFSTQGIVFIRFIFLLRPVLLNSKFEFPNQMISVGGA